ncbi:hypothetical protein RIF29_30124 [Crotalaria pallida]|uniref:Uncharacterized protein n=1 Tax=Crotalaria pallida TaxID=3830 RepID=A0AAN9EGK7_CROPI
MRYNRVFVATINGKEKGRPPKQSPSTAKKDDNHREINESIVIDFSKLDDIDLDNLPPTQVDKESGASEGGRSGLGARDMVSAVATSEMHISGAALESGVV